MQPNTSDGDSGAEHNFRLTASGTAVSVSVDGQTTPISTITPSGWYDFQMTYSPDPIGTNPELTSMNIFSVDGSSNPATLTGTTNVVADSPGGPAASDVVTGSGYVWFPSGQTVLREMFWVLRTWTRPSFPSQPP
jgi:hypothetical protein